MSSDTLRYAEPDEGGEPVAAENISITGVSGHFQVVKLALGERGSYQGNLKFGQTVAASSIPVTLASDTTVTTYSVEIMSEDLGMTLQDYNAVFGIKYVDDPAGTLVGINNPLPVGLYSQKIPLQVQQSGNWEVSITGQPVNVSQNGGWTVAITGQPISIQIVEEIFSSNVSVPSAITINTTAIQLIPSNSTRKRVTLQNIGTTTIKVNLGTETPTQTLFHFSLPNCLSSGDGIGGFYSDDLWKGAIKAISSSSGGACSIFETI